MVRSGRLLPALLAGLGLYAAATAGAAADEMKLVRISTARSVGAPALWGIGPFAAKYNIKTEVTAAITNADMQRALQNGVEIGQLGYQSPAVMAEQNVGNVKIVAGEYIGGQNLIMRKAVPLKAWRDLEGKKIGRPPGTYVGVLFTLAAETHGVDLNKVNIVNTTAAGTAELQALKSGDLDGLLLWSPIIDRAVAEGYADYPPCCDIGDTKEFGAGDQIIAANTDFIKDRKDAVNFLKAFAEALDYYDKHRDKAVELIAQYTGAPKDALEVSMKHATWDVRVDIATSEAIAKVAPKFGITKNDMSAKVKNYFDLSLLAEATGRPVAELGTFGH